MLLQGSSFFITRLIIIATTRPVYGVF